MFFNAQHLLVACSLALAIALPAPDNPGASSLSNAKSSLTFLFQNSLNFTDDANHVGAILLDPITSSSASSACAALGEQLVSRATIQAHQSDFLHQLSYNAYAGRAARNQSYLISNGTVALNEKADRLSFPASPMHNARLPVLCTQSSNQNSASNAVATASNQITVSAAGNTYVGYRNQKSFRFLGIRYADAPERFVYSSLYSTTGQTLNATAYGPQCAQSGSGSEDCLFLNIQTPYIPKAGSKDRLRPVMFWIHGGGFTGGSGADPGSDGGQLASREDIVVVNINYRLSTLGFLAIPGTDIKGNFGIGDQITALQVSVSRPPILKNKLTYVVDDQQHCSIWWRSQTNHYQWRICRCRIRKNFIGFASCYWEISGCNSYEQPWRWARLGSIRQLWNYILTVLHH